jgi:8-oxo-dGTP pyrophosphatase MutT (NUDIX family)
MLGSDMPNAHATSPPPFSEAAFRAAAGLGLRPVRDLQWTAQEPESTEGPSDFDLNPDALRELLAHPPPRPAAVLVPVIARPQLSVLLTLRTDTLPSHAGQISFPGGKMEPDDADPVATALREAREEVGLHAAFVEPLGYLDPYRTGTGFRIFPVVALVRTGFALALDEAEVADAFEVPLDFLMDARNHQMHVRTWRGAERRFYAMPFQERYIWGATAGIMKNMHQRLFPT